MPLELKIPTIHYVEGRMDVCLTGLHLISLEKAYQNDKTAIHWAVRQLYVYLCLINLLH